MNFDLLSLWAYSALVFEPGSRNRALNRIRYVSAARRARPRLAPIMVSPGAAALRTAQRRDGRLAGFVVWPYVNRTFDLDERYKLLVAHHAAVEHRHPWVNLEPGASLLMTDLGVRLPGLQVRLENAPWFIREGALNLSLMLQGERLISVSFTLRESEGGLDALVGSIQGNARSDIVDTYKLVADAMNDLRPRDLLFKIFRLFATHLGVRTVLCVADTHHVQHHAFFGGTKSHSLKLRYDELWVDQGGVLQDDGFYAMPAAAQERPLSDVPIKKRGRYKRRQEMFADIDALLSTAIGSASANARPHP